MSHISGNHLHEGDCLDLLDSLGDASVDLIVTDPPYGVSYRSNRQRVDRKKSVKENQSVVCRNHFFDQIANDDSIPTEWLEGAYRVLKPDSALYAFVHWTKWTEMVIAASNYGFQVKNMIVLNKSNHGMGDLKGSYAPKHELLMFAVKGRHVCRWPNGRQSDVWSVPVKFSGGHRFHPNEKPLSWLEPAILNSSDEGAVVLDPFMGSGSTGVACAKMNRKFIGAEMDSSYAAIAKERIENQMRAMKGTIDWE